MDLFSGLTPLRNGMKMEAEVNTGEHVIPAWIRREGSRELLDKINEERK